MYNDYYGEKCYFMGYSALERMRVINKEAYGIEYPCSPQDLRSKKNISNIERSCLTFIRELCENLRFDPAKSDLSDRDGGSIKKNMIPFNMEMDIDRLCLENAVHRFMQSGTAQDAFDIYFCFLEMYLGDYAKAKDGTLAAWYTGTAPASGTTVKATESGLNNPEGNAFAPGDTISMYAVIFKGNSIASATEYLVSDVVMGSVKANGANFSVSYGSLSATTTANKFLNSTWQSVPEPTSGLLMLVGLGALALRRRRA